MAIYGINFEWRFVESVYLCDIENCQEETIIVERSTGQRLCLKHAQEVCGSIDSAKKNLYRDENDYSFIE